MDDERADALSWIHSVEKIWTGPKYLRNSLLDSAMHHARLALRDFTKGSNEAATAGLHAGIALEHMAKCYLSSLHPVLLADKNCDMETLLHLVGKGDLARSDPLSIKTIGAVEACRRARHFCTEFRFNEASDELLFAARNSAAHLGLGSELHKAMRIMVRLVDPLLNAVGYDRTMFWGNWISIVNTLQDENIGELQATLQMKYEAARNHLTMIFDGLEPNEQATAKAILARGAHSSSDYDSPYQCPVCEAQGWLICSREYDVTEEGDVVFNEPIAYPFNFVCNVCGLDLEDSELGAAGMPSQINLPDSEIGRIL